VHVQITDRGSAPPAGPTEVPDIEAKLAGLQRPRGWGLFLIKNMVDDSREIDDGDRHTLELTMRLEATNDH
jgi:anti-sigma regulatory factor (Ser/Thr protein kinase)